MTKEEKSFSRSTFPPPNPSSFSSPLPPRRHHLPFLVLWEISLSFLFTRKDSWYPFLFSFSFVSRFFPFLFRFFFPLRLLATRFRDLPSIRIQSLCNPWLSFLNCFSLVFFHQKAFALIVKYWSYFNAFILFYFFLSFPSKTEDKIIDAIFRFFFFSWRTQHFWSSFKWRRYNFQKPVFTERRHSFQNKAEGFVFFFFLYEFCVSSSTRSRFENIGH